VLAGSAASRQTAPSFAFGRTGGNIVPFTVRIGKDGRVTSSGPVQVTATGPLSLPLRNGLARLARAEGFFALPTSIPCSGINPDVAGRFVTVRAGGSVDHDEVFAVGGTPVGLSSARIIASHDHQPKRVQTGTVGISRVLSRRWLVSLDGSRTFERGYLTEPYKIVSIISADSGLAVGSVTEKRPATRDRRSLLASSVYHFPSDVLYLSYRYYWDDWGVRSHTLDGRYRIDLNQQTFVQPHVRLYTQSRADFFTFGINEDVPLPSFATSDERLGPLHSVTVGATYGFRIPGHAGEFTVRGEWIHQWGSGRMSGASPSGEVEGGQSVSLFPPLEIATVTAGYTIGF